MINNDLSDTSSESDNEIRYDTVDDEWQDAEPDQERVEILSLFDDQKFLDIKSMLDYCKDKYNFDLLDINNRLSEFNSNTPWRPGKAHIL
jgi:type I protein arginine methyltransferase